MLLRQFGQDGRIDFRGYAALYSYIQDWQQQFARFDVDRSGTIEPRELGNALQAFGYNLDPQLVQLLAKKYTQGTPPPVSHGGYRAAPVQAALDFDTFVRVSSCTGD